MSDKITELLELVDGAMSVVETWKAEHPAQVKWKNVWLEKARKHLGACPDCNGTGWYGDNGPGVRLNNELVRCDCGTANKCQIGVHRYVMIDSVPWCCECNLEADLDICRDEHPVAGLEHADTGFIAGLIQRGSDAEKASASDEWIRRNGQAFPYHPSYENSQYPASGNYQ